MRMALSFVLRVLLQDIEGSTPGHVDGLELSVQGPPPPLGHANGR